MTPLQVDGLYSSQCGVSPEELSEPDGGGWSSDPPDGIRGKRGLTPTITGETDMTSGAAFIIGRLIAGSDSSLVPLSLLPACPGVSRKQGPD
ncbi:MAG: hypothetical protein R6U98_15165 [Pirellulaceae bacterium]